MSDDTLYKELLRQEEDTVFPYFTIETALDLGMFLVAKAQEQSLPVTISVKKAGQRIFHAALPGTSIDNDDWVEKKGRVVERYGHSSFAVGEGFRVQDTTFEASSRLDPTLYAGHGGVFPVIVEGVGVVGTAGVSGLPQEVDHAFVVASLTEFISAL